MNIIRGIYISINILLTLQSLFVYAFNEGDTTQNTFVTAPGGEDKDELNDRFLATLQEKWFLDEAGSDFGRLKFVLNYTTSDFIIDSMINGTVYSKECMEGGILIPSSVVNKTVILDDTPPGAGDNFRNISVDLQINSEKIYNSIAYTESYDANGRKKAQVKFCFRFSLYTNGDAPIEVNFLETEVTLSVDLTSDFAIDAINVGPKEKLVEEAKINYQVEGFQCNYFNEPLSVLELAVARNQGSIIRVCVRPNAEARDQGIVMKIINSFTFNRDYGGPIGVVTQAAITDGRAAPNFLTNLDCEEGVSVCVFETVLFASMYMTPGTVAGSGEATMKFQGTRKEQRILLLRAEKGNSYPSDDRRKVQALDPFGTLATPSRFDMDFDLMPQLSYTDQLRLQASASRITVSYLSIGMIVITWLHL